MSEHARLINDLQRATETLGPIFATTANIHDHTRRIGSTTKPFLARDPLSTNTQEMTQLRAEILRKCPPQLAGKVTSALTSIAAKGDGVDGETGLNALELLRRSWALTKLPCAPSNSAELICDNLAHNAATGGGCLAGICGRLCQVYLNLLLWGLERQPVPGFAPADYDEDQALLQAILASTHAAPLTPQHAAATGADDDLLAGIAASLESQQQQDDEDANMARAIAASMNYS